jgi:hypothetical protein
MPPRLLRRGPRLERRAIVLVDPGGAVDPAAAQNEALDAGVEADDQPARIFVSA